MNSTRTFVVTGAGRGIGLGLVRQLLARGERVVATARSTDDLAKLALEGSRQSGLLRVMTLDVTRDDQVAALGEALASEPVDVLVNNAGVGGWRGLGELDPAEALRFYDVNALGPLRVTRALLPSLRAGRGRTVAHVTSRMGSIADNASGGSYAYRMSKAALNMASRSLSIDLAPSRIASFVVHPGWVRTDMGGPDATVSIDESVGGLLRLLEGDTLSRSGRFFDFKGGELPW